MGSNADNDDVARGPFKGSEVQGLLGCTETSVSRVTSFNCKMSVLAIIMGARDVYGPSRCDVAV